MIRSRRKIGSHPAAVWAVKHLVSPLDRLVVRVSGGRLPPLSSIAVPTLLLTTRGRRTGQDRTVPLVYVRDGERFIVANARPAGERSNPWIANLQAAGHGRVRQKGRMTDVRARVLDADEADRWWPALVDIWPAFDEHYAATGERTVFVLEPTNSAPG
jgi:deazaflavin-dependent oxidoreductase (nitroreductase family)